MFESIFNYFIQILEFWASKNNPQNRAVPLDGLLLGLKNVVHKQQLHILNILVLKCRMPIFKGIFDYSYRIMKFQVSKSNPKMWPVPMFGFCMVLQCKIFIYWLHILKVFVLKVLNPNFYKAYLIISLQFHLVHQYIPSNLGLSLIHQPSRNKGKIGKLDNFL